MRAWHLLPQKGGCQADLTEITQRREEPYSDFVSGVMEAATGVFPDTWLAMPFIQQLAYGNANSVEMLSVHTEKNR